MRSKEIPDTLAPQAELLSTHLDGQPTKLINISFTKSDDKYNAEGETKAIASCLEDHFG